MASESSCTPQIDMHCIPDDENIYAPGEIGPYSVILDKQESNIIQIAKQLKYANLADYDNIIAANKKTRSRFVVVYNNTVRANCLLRCEYLKSQGYKIFLPRTYGIIKHIPLVVTTQDVMKNYTSYVPIIEAERFLRRNKETGLLEQTETIKLTFRGDYKPELIQLLKISCRVSHFIPPPQQCNNCFRFGHSKFNCRLKNSYAYQKTQSFSDKGGLWTNTVNILEDLKNERHLNPSPELDMGDYDDNAESSEGQHFYRNHHNKHWWNGNIQELWEAKQAAQTNFNRVKDLHTALQLKQLKAKLKIEIKRARRRAFNELMKKFNEIL